MNMAAILWKFELFNVALIWLQIRNLRPRISGIGLFWTLFINFWPLFITCQNFEEICKYVRLTVCLFVCLCVTRCRSQFLTNHLQTSSTYVAWPNTGLYTFYRSKVIQHPMRTCQEELLSPTGLLTKKNRAWRVPLPLNNIIFYKSREGSEFWSKPSTVLWFMPRNMH